LSGVQLRVDSCADAGSANIASSVAATARWTAFFMVAPGFWSAHHKKENIIYPIVFLAAAIPKWLSMLRRHR
jgi:hypothetical protein